MIKEFKLQKSSASINGFFKAYNSAIPALKSTLTPFSINKSQTFKDAYSKFNNF